MGLVLSCGVKGYYTSKGAGGTLVLSVVRGGHSGHFAENIVKNIVPSHFYHGYRLAIWLSFLGDD